MCNVTVILSLQTAFLCPQICVAVLIAWWRCKVGHGPLKILVGWATMHLASSIISLYIRLLWLCKINFKKTNIRSDNGLLWIPWLVASRSKFCRHQLFITINFTIYTIVTANRLRFRRKQYRCFHVKYAVGPNFKLKEVNGYKKNFNWLMFKIVFHTKLNVPRTTQWFLFIPSPNLVERGPSAADLAHPKFLAWRPLCLLANLADWKTVGSCRCSIVPLIYIGC